MVAPQDPPADVLLRFAYYMVTEEYHSGKANSTLLTYFTSVCGLSLPNGSEFLGPGKYTTHLSGFIYCVRLIMLEAALPCFSHKYVGIKARSRRGQLEILQRLRQEKMCDGTMSPLGEMISLFTFGTALRQSNGPTFCFEWSGDGETIAWDGDCRLTMTDFRSLVHEVLESAARASQHLMYNWEPPEPDYKRIRDRLSTSTVGYSFVTDSVNGLQRAHFELFTRACLSPVDCLLQKTRDGESAWDRAVNKDNLERVRKNQRRSRARKKEYLQRLEQQLRACELHGVEASAEMQAAARRVTEENKQLRKLLSRHGVSNESITEYLHFGTIFAPEPAQTSFPGVNTGPVAQYLREPLLPEQTEELGLGVSSQIPSLLSRAMQATSPSIVSSPFYEQMIMALPEHAGGAGGDVIGHVQPRNVMIISATCDGETLVLQQEEAAFARLSIEPARLIKYMTGAHLRITDLGLPFAFGIDFDGNICSTCWQWIGPSEFSTSELRTLTTALYDFNGAIKTFQTHLEICEENEARLVSLEYLENALTRCGQALEIINQFMERRRVMDKVLLGPKFDRKLKASLAILQGAKELFMLVVQADQQYVRNVAQDARDIQAITQHNGLQLGEIRKMQTDQNSAGERQAVLDWLGSSDHAAVQSDYFNRRQQGTWQWFLESAAFTDWLDTDSKTLICLGIPGAGKTILMSTVVHHLQERYRSVATATLAYVYLNYGRQDEQNLQQLLTSLLQQACQRESQFPDCVKSLYDQHKEHKTRPSIAELSTALQSITKAHDMHEFRGMRSVDIRANGSDIQEYLSGQMFRLPRVVRHNQELQEQVRTEIVGASDGLFLLAKLHLDSLVGKTSVKSVKAALQSLPKGSGLYDAAYDMTIVRLRGQDADSVELAKQALMWLACAKRPLTTAELQHALAVEKDTGVLDEENLNAIEDIVSVCTGLITVDRESDIVRIAHRTAHQYLQRIRQDWFPQADRDIATTCLTYLSFVIFRNGSCSTDDHLDTRLANHPLYSYAAHWWAYHARKEAVPSKFVLGFLQNNSLVQAASQVTNFDSSRWRPGYGQRIPKQVTGLHLATRFGIPEAVDSLLTHNGVGIKVSTGRTPLTYAAEGGHMASAEILLDFGAKTNAVSSTGRTPLSYSAHARESDMAKMLLSNRAAVDSEDIDGDTPLCWAAMQGNEDMLRYLIAQGAGFGNAGGNGRTPLSYAASNGHDSIIKILCQEFGADPDQADAWGQTPLLRAAREGHVKTVEVLIKQTAKLDAKDNVLSQTALSHAAQWGYTSIVQLLVENGADPLSEDMFGETPLDYAVNYEQIAVLELLRQRTGEETLC
ncbi:hypothetical protein O9K51_08397 [Purpureocillium lavendulum]|uniref:Uncharacterized protein n=1 Tax=Purpureocillium lavendulum TaxID=1247861 RepID=A0AB34FJW0_9HYPO|nr:hypothetical protein O9K51_08397 [Purpureocillium lavendulum]